jgi:hypothetical protein
MSRQCSKSSSTPGLLFFSFQDLDSTKPAGSVKIRVETIAYYLERSSARARRSTAPARFRSCKPALRDDPGHLSSLLTTTGPGLTPPRTRANPS